MRLVFFAISVRPINGTAKDNSPLSNCLYSKQYPLPSALADGH